MANQTEEQETAPVTAEGSKPKYPGIPVTCNGNQLVTQWVETRITEGGVFYPITPSTEGGEIYQQAFAQGALDVWGNQKLAVETEGEHAAQGGATAVAMTGKRTVNFTSARHCLCHGAILPRAWQALDDGSGSGRARLTSTRSTCTAATMIFMPLWTQAGRC